MTPSWSNATITGAKFKPKIPVKLIVPNAPGGAMDIIARLLSVSLSELWSPATLHIEYRPGANTMLGTEQLTHAKADGHTLAVIATPHVINPALHKLRYDTEKDVAPLIRIGTSDLLLSCAPDFEAKNLDEAIARIRDNPGRYSYATAGIGSSMHLAFELLKQRAGLDLTHIPFNGSAPAFTELASGRIALMMEPVFSCLPHIGAGRLRPLATTGRQRNASLPGTPYLAETFPELHAESFFGVAAPGATPPTVLEALRHDLSLVLSSPETIDRLKSLGIRPTVMSSSEFSAFISDEIRKWKRLIQEIDLKIQ